MKDINETNNVIVSRNTSINGYNLKFQGLFITFDSFNVIDNFFFAYNDNHVCFFTINLDRTKVYYKTSNNKPYVYQLGE